MRLQGVVFAGQTHAELRERNEGCCTGVGLMLSLLCINAVVSQIYQNPHERVA